MNLLVGIKSLQAWHGSIKQSNELPRLPLPYAFSTAFTHRDHKIFAIDYSNAGTPSRTVSPFEYIYQQNEILQAMRNVDMAILWGGHGISAILRQIMLPHLRCRVLFGSYIWQLSTLPTLKKKAAGMAARYFARFSRAVIVMTDEQLVLAKQILPSHIPVIRFICGIDTSFYKIKSNYSDVPEIHRPSIDKLMSKPYVIMLGDQQRCDKDALKLLEHSDINLVRVCREKKTIAWFNENIQKHGLNDRLYVFEDIDYKFLRFLLHHASAYAGLVDSKWQPAGWTVACEALASGLPLVLYEGLVSRELKKIGIDESWLRIVPMGDVNSFQNALDELINNRQGPEVSLQIRNFAATTLDFEVTAENFVRQVEKLAKYSNK